VAKVGRNQGPSPLTTKSDPMQRFLLTFPGLGSHYDDTSSDSASLRLHRPHPRRLTRRVKKSSIERRSPGTSRPWAASCSVMVP
jgi:hypothetical protein